MKSELEYIIKSKDFHDILNQDGLKLKLIEGGGGTDQREILYRNAIYGELERIHPGDYLKEKLGRKDLWCKKTKSLCEVGHNGTWQPSRFAIDKADRDFIKRSMNPTFNHYYALLIITDFLMRDPSHKVGATYINPIDRINSNRLKARQRISDINAYALSHDKDSIYHSITLTALGGSQITIHFFLFAMV